MDGGGFDIVEGHRSGALGRLVEMHALYYAREWGFGIFFETKVATESAVFFDRINAVTDRAWFVLQGGTVVGSLIIDGGEVGSHIQGAHLRWFILDEACRGQGLGDQLMRQAVDFCDKHGFARVYLTTFAGLDAARALYERHGFQLVRETADRTWGSLVTEQLFERLPATSSEAERNM